MIAVVFEVAGPHCLDEWASGWPQLAVEVLLAGAMEDQLARGKM